MPQKREYPALAAFAAFLFLASASLRHNLELKEQQACPTISINGALTPAQCGRGSIAPTRARIPSRSFSLPATSSKTRRRRRRGFPVPSRGTSTRVSEDVAGSEKDR